MTGAGDLRQFVRIEKPSKIPDGRGGYSLGAWIIHLECAARIERRKPFVQGIEARAAGAVFSELMVQIVIAASDEAEAITSEMRAVEVDTQKRFNILAAQNIDGIRQYITLTAMENAAA